MDETRIIYLTENGGLAIIIPAHDISLEQALAAVPDNSPYLVVSASDIPSDRTFRNAWVADFSTAPIKEQTP